jgi:2,2-dialkylglycine decarboxylase (pyruvate)
MNDEAAGGAPDWRERRRGLQDAVERHMIRYIGDFPPFFVERAEGSYFFDDSGRRILDFTSGQMCATLGHNHPDVVAAIGRSCERALHLFSWVLAPEVVELCRELAALLPQQL